MDRSVVGHINIRKKLLELLKSDRLAHANLFVGSMGIGKKLVAKELAKATICEAPSPAACGECSNCKLFESGNHPDFQLIEGADFSAEDARELLSSIALKPFKSSRRVVILNDADSISTVVANLLLKTLEEPSKNNLFILIASNQSSLPMPVISRCQQWRFSNLGKREVEQVISVHAEAQKIESLAELCDGTLEQLDILIKNESESKHVLKTLDRIIEGDSFQALKFASELAKDKTTLTLKLSMLRALLRMKLGAEALPHKRLAIAEALENLIHSDRLIHDRNFNALNLLEITLLGLSGKQHSTVVDIVI